LYWFIYLLKTPNHVFFVVLSVIMIGSIAFVTTANGIQPIIPPWIKNNAKWWSEGTISDADYISGLQYLMSHGIIQIPINQVIATNSGLSDTTMAKSFVVHFKTDRGNFDVYTISKIVNFGQTTSTQVSSAQQLGGTGSPQFQFESIPSKDKKQYYDLLAYYINTNGNSKDTTDVSIDIIAGDASVIETLHYTNCQVASYYVYVNDNKENYRLSQNDGPELRDDAQFACQGLQIITP